MTNFAITNPFAKPFFVGHQSDLRERERGRGRGRDRERYRERERERERERNGNEAKES